MACLCASRRQAYRRALQLDCCCYEAFKHLTQHHLLSAQDEQTLMSEISFGAEDKWLELLYRAKVSRYQTAAAGAKPPPSPATAAAELEPGEEAAPAQDMAIDGGSSGGGYTRAPPIVDLDELESGYNLRGNLDLLAQRAEVLYYGHHLRAAAESCRAILRRDPHSLSAMPTYLCALHELALKNELFYQAHQLVDHHPQEAVAWFAVGCYYHLVGSYDSARRYFEKATHLDNWFAPAWLGYGHAFAAQDESDQAMVAYRIAAKLFPGCHFCPLFVGMECARTHNLPLASRYFAQAMEICPIDPLTYHEVGVVHYQNHELGRARECFLRVLELTCGGGGGGDSRTGSSSERRLEPWLETTLFNLGHTCRKLKSYDEAIGYYGQALHAQPHKASTYAALGFTYHLKVCIDASQPHLVWPSAHSGSSPRIMHYGRRSCVHVEGSHALRVSACFARLLQIHAGRDTSSHRPLPPSARFIAPCMSFLFSPVLGCHDHVCAWQALGLKSEDTFATSMLQKAFEEMAHVPIRGI
jgi:anaphase-promoting complex subunit 6|eukprot:SAG25_NODE_1220_length_3576_cov_2.680184_2_plen_527_part_00